jgi:aminobenzoyl-glutamate transport protein
MSDDKGNAAPERRRVDRFFDVMERLGNALPDPVTLFALLAALLAALVVVLSGIATQFDLAVTHPATGKLIEPVSLLSVEGLHRILTSLVTNFTGFAPLGAVLVAMTGIGAPVSLPVAGAIAS